MLVFSLAAAARHRLGRRAGRPAAATALPAGSVAVAIAGIAATSFLVRLVCPLGSEQAHLQLALFPQYAGLFTFGLAAARRGWLAAPSRSRERACGRAALAAAVLLPALLVATGGVDEGAPVLGGAQWQSGALCTLEGVLSTCASLWVLERFRRRELRALHRWGGDVAYGAYVVHAPVIVGLALLVHAAPGPAELKFVVAAPAGLALSFGLVALRGRMVEGTLRRGGAMIRRHRSSGGPSRVTDRRRVPTSEPDQAIQAISESGKVA